MSSWNNQDKHLDVLQNIENGLVELYVKFDSLTDSQVVMGLDYAEIALNQLNGYSKGRHVNREGAYGEVISAIMEVYNLRMKIGGIDSGTFIQCVKQVKNSVERHRHHGIRGYYEFVKNFL